MRLALSPGTGEILDGHDQRRVGDDPQLAVDLVGALGEDARCGPASAPWPTSCAASFASFLPSRFAFDLGPYPVQELVDVQVVVPRIERAHPGRLPHLLADTRGRRP